MDVLVSPLWIPPFVWYLVGVITTVDQLSLETHWTGAGAILIHWVEQCPVSFKAALRIPRLIAEPCKAGLG